MRDLSCDSASTSASSKEEPSAADFRPKALLAAYYNRVRFSGFSKRHLQLIASGYSFIHNLLRRSITALAKRVAYSPEHG